MFKLPPRHSACLKGVDDCIASPSQQKKQKTIAQTEPLRLNLSEKTERRDLLMLSQRAGPLTGRRATANRSVVILLHLLRTTEMKKNGKH